MSGLPGAGVWAPIRQSPFPAPGPGLAAACPQTQLLPGPASARALTLCRSQGAAPPSCLLFSKALLWVGVGGLSPFLPAPRHPGQVAVPTLGPWSVGMWCFGPRAAPAPSTGLPDQPSTRGALGPQWLLTWPFSSPCWGKPLPLRAQTGLVKWEGLRETQPRLPRSQRLGLWLAS